MESIKTLKITHVIDFLALGGGAQRLVMDICLELIKRSNIEVQILTFKKPWLHGEVNADLWEEKIKGDLNLVLCNCTMRFNLFGKSFNDVDEYVSNVKSFQPDIIHSHILESELLSRTVLFPNVKYVSHLHDNFNIFNKPNSFLSDWKINVSNYFIAKWLIEKYRQCNNNFISISKDTEEYFGKHFPTDFSERMFTLPNAVDLSRFGNPKEKSINVDEQIRLISVGSLVEKKNQIFLIDVVHYLKSNGYNIKLKLLGDGPTRKVIERKITDLNLEANVELLGYVDTVTEELNNSHIYVHSATYEPFGLALIEGMASGLPVVTLNGKGNVELINEGVNGFMVHENDSEKFALKIIDLIKDPDRYQKMSIAAINFSKEFGMVKYVDELLDIYKSLK